MSVKRRAEHLYDRRIDVDKRLQETDDMLGDALKALDDPRFVPGEIEQIVKFLENTKKYIETEVANPAQEYEASVSAPPL